jgi:hypothetical protein
MMENVVAFTLLVIAGGVAVVSKKSEKKSIVRASKLQEDLLQLEREREELGKRLREQEEACEALKQDAEARKIEFRRFYEESQKAIPLLESMNVSPLLFLLVVYAGILHSERALHSPPLVSHPCRSFTLPAQSRDSHTRISCIHT